jgi:aspartate/methionine/tyrosine aminotransferase
VHQRLNAIGLNCPKPAGTFYLFPDFDDFKAPLQNSGIITSHRLVNTLLKDAGVALLPGSDFYMPATSLSARVAAVDFDGTHVLESWPGIDNVTDDYFEKAFPKIKQGCNILKDFLDRL